MEVQEGVTQPGQGLRLSRYPRLEGKLFSGSLLFCLGDWGLPRVHTDPSIDRNGPATKEHRWRKAECDSSVKILEENVKVQGKVGLRGGGRERTTTKK